MKRHLIVSLLAIWICACQPAPDQALGTIERDRVTLTATASEIIRQLPKHEGQKVKVGDVLVQLDTKNQQALLAEAKAQQAKANAALLRLTNGERPEDIAAASAQVQQAKAKDIQAEKAFIRIRDLFAQRLVSQSNLDKARADRDTARANLHSATEAFLKLTAGARVEDVEQAKAELAAAQAQAALQQQRLKELTITATRNGILDNLPYNLGERPPLAGIVAIIQANSVPYARVYVPASHRIKMVIGAQVPVHVDGVKGSFAGKVRRIATEPSFSPYYALTESERSHLMYLAEITLPFISESLPSGVPAQADLSHIQPPESVIDERGVQ
ncbi:biotin/lipoyl-binding protein [Parashewanella curva]|uniref:Biotin/lipoyl-binding protein n=1 Tax=Parashewanella curva TaxID=2338552 RepID=A0A3L8PUU2_9GAMM|nr:biotin/lipoyl-binding protein [Parashewanella curva]RLV59086.1 biotin/lipoyl-binding protein [Parashewanella curva]